MFGCLQMSCRDELNSCYVGAGWGRWGRRREGGIEEERGGLVKNRVEDTVGDIGLGILRRGDSLLTMWLGILYIENKQEIFEAMFLSTQLLQTL